MSIRFMESLITVKSLGKRFGEVVAADDVSFTVDVDEKLSGGLTR